MKDALKKLEASPAPNEQGGKTPPDAGKTIDLASKIAGGKALLAAVEGSLKAAGAVQGKMSAWMRGDSREFPENMSTILYQHEADVAEWVKSLRAFEKPAAANDRKGLETILGQASSALTKRTGLMERDKAIDKKFPYPKDYVPMLLELFGKVCDALNGVGAFIAHWQPEISSVKIPAKVSPPSKWAIAEQPLDAKSQGNDAPAPSQTTDTAARWKIIQSLQQSIAKAGNSILSDLKKIHAAAKAIDHPAAKRFAVIVAGPMESGYTSGTWFSHSTSGFSQLQKLAEKDLADVKKFNVQILHIKSSVENMRLSSSGTDVLANLDGSPFANTNIFQTSNRLMDEIIQALNQMAV